MNNDFWIWPFNHLFRKPPIVQEFDVLLPDEVRARHSALFGSPRMGKTKMLEVIMTSDVIRRVHGLGQHGWCFFDVHGEASDELISRLALLALKFPMLYDLIVIVDPSIADWSVVYNPLEIRKGESAKLKAQNLTDAFITVYKDDPTVVVRMYRVAYNTFLPLALSGRSLIDAPEFLTNRTFREQVVHEVNDPAVTRFWMSEFPKKDGNEATARVESTLNRVDRVAQSQLAPLLWGTGSLNFRELMDRGCFVIGRAPQGKIGSDAAYLLPALLISEFNQAAFTREDSPPKKRRPFTLFADEFTVYLTAAISQSINQLSKYRLEFFLSTQQVEAHLTTKELLGAVVGAVGNIFSLRLGYNDAEALVRELFTPSFDQIKSIDDTHTTWRSIEEIWQREIRKLVALPKRRLWWREKGNLETRYLRTVDLDDVEKLPDAHLIPEARTRLFEEVSKRWGRINITISDDIPAHD